MKKIDTVCSLVGCPFLQNNFKILSFWPIVAVANLVIYTFAILYNLYESRNDISRVLLLMVNIAALFQGILRVNVFLIKREKISDLVARSERFITNFNTQRSNEIFERWLMILSHLGAFMTIQFTILAAGATLFPLVYFAFSGELILHSGFEIPFLDWHKSFGYILNFIYGGWTQIYYFVVSQFVSTFLLLLFVLLAIGQYEILNSLLDELSVLANGNKNGRHNAEIKTLIGKIADMHNELIE